MWAVARLQMSQGDKVRRACWGSGVYLCISDGAIRLVYNDEGYSVRWEPHSTHKRATDWEVAP
jgi:hypothetical protein